MLTEITDLCVVPEIAFALLEFHHARDDFPGV